MLAGAAHPTVLSLRQCQSVETSQPNWQMYLPKNWRSSEWELASQTAQLLDVSKSFLLPKCEPMNEANTRRLFERFDQLYRGRHLPDTQNLMCYGFSCEDGWFTLIWHLSEQIEAYCQTHPDAANVIVVQVKQKLGELRFYTQPKIWDVEYLIEAARIRSLQTCELTGTSGALCQLPSEVGLAAKRCRLRKLRNWALCLPPRLDCIRNCHRAHPAESRGIARLLLIE